MRRSVVIGLAGLIVLLGFLIIRSWVLPAEAPAKQGAPAKGNVALESLVALVSFLETNKQTKALQLFGEYSSASMALLSSTDIGQTLRVLVALREGRTNDAIALMEFKLDSDITTFADHYREMSIAQQGKLGLHSLSEAKWYRQKYPREDTYGVRKRAFDLLDSKGVE